MSDGVDVAIRLRPPIEGEKDENSSSRWLVQGNVVASFDPNIDVQGNDGFHFDHIFDMDATNSTIFDIIARPIVDAAINGFNGTVFSYGQSSSGKTHTMLGTSEEPGIIPLAINEIFKAISSTIGREFLLRVSYLEIHDEKVNDLLNHSGTNLQLSKDDNGQVIVNCKEEITNSPENMLSVLQKGLQNKRISENNRNECNSSHSIFRITIESQEAGRDSDSIVQVSQLNLVDLAGSKRAHRIDAIERQRIDISLSTLATIIMQLSESENGKKYVNYHNSKLTELLQTSLGGNSLTAAICTVIPVALEETYYTLSFANEAKDVKNKPQKNEIVSDVSLLIRYTKQLTKLQAELEKIRNENSCVEVEDVDSKLQEKYHTSQLLEERIKLLKRQIVPGCITNHEEPFKCKIRRRQTWSSPATFKQHLPAFHTKSGLPTIKEMSPEKPYPRNSIQSVDAVNQPFQTVFTDFELDLLQYDTEYEVKENGNSIEENNLNSIFCVRSKKNGAYSTPDKQDSSVQTLSSQVSPSTPKNVLRKYISELSQDLAELREFTTLEKQLMCQENHCCSPNVEEQLPKRPDLLKSKDNDIYEYSSNLIIQLQDQKAKLAEELALKIQELSEIKNDIQGLKLDTEKLQKTIYLLTNENMEMSNKLSVEKEHSKQAEIDLQRTIDELYVRISKITDEKINLESDLTVLNDHLQSIRSKTPETYSDEQLHSRYKSKIDALKTENIELSTIITEKNKELENIKESKSLLYDHECLYKDKVAILTERNKYLVAENNELSTDVMDKIEENETLREQNEILNNKLSLAKSTNSDENDIQQFRSENKLLKTEILELKMKVTMLSDENAKFSNNLLETMEDLDNSRSEKLNNSTPSLSAMVESNIKTDDGAKTLQEENCEQMENKVAMLQEKIDHLTRLNKKLSDLKLSSCSQCAHLKNLNESRRALKLEAKVLNHKLEDLQRKFDKKCADTEALKMKVNQDLNLSFVDGSLNSSFADGMNVSFVEEKVQHLSNELQTLKNDRDKLSVMYREKCDELEKLHDDVPKPKKNTVQKEPRIEQIQKSIDQVRDDIDELKKNSTNFTSMLNKFRAEKASLLAEINSLKSINEELQQKVFDNEISAATATEKAKILENEVLNMSKELEECSVKEKVIRSEKLTLEVELEDLKAERQHKDVLITKLHTTIDDLNDCISSLKIELDTMTSQKNELVVSSESTELKYKDELELLKKQFEDLEKEKERSVEAEKRAILWAKELETDIERLQTDLTKQESLYTEVQGKVYQLEHLLQESEDEKEVLKQKLQTLEIQLIDSKDNVGTMYRNEFESLTQKFQEYTKESEIKLSKINETLNKYVEENGSLSQELANLQDIELKFNKMKEENEKKLLTNANSKTLKEELDTVRGCMIKELKSLKYKVNCVNFLSKTADEIFIIFLQTLMSKEEEVIRKMREMFEKDKQKLEDENRQCADSEKRVISWAKELETEIEKLQTDLTKRENMYKDHQDKIFQLEHVLQECKYEKETLRKKLETLEIDFNNMQAELDKRCKVDGRQEEAMIVAQKREKEAQEAFRNKENELQSKMRSERQNYEKKIEELVCTIESYKTKNMELKNNIECLEANGKQLKNIIEANSTELKMNSQTIHKLNIDLEQLTEAYNEVNREVDQKTSKIENITALLKSKCDMLSEYKSKLESIMPDYETLQDQVKERKASIEKYKEEIEELKMEKDKQIEMIKDKLNSEEIKNIGLNKQFNELSNKNKYLVEELDGLKEKYEELRHANTKLEKKIRNSTSKIKAEAEMEELRDVNKRLQNNLEGASNRILDLQDSKNKMLKELVNLKGQYEFLSQENVEMKKTLASYKSRQSTPRLSQEDGRYDALLQQKNKIALELEGKKLLLNQRDKEIKEYVTRVRDLIVRNREFDVEISSLKHELYVRQIENKLVNELEEKLKNLAEKNKELQAQIDEYKSHPHVDTKQMEDIKLYSERVFHMMRKENSELKAKLCEYENKLESKSNSSGSRCASPALEISRRRHSRSEIFNQRRQIDNTICHTDINENEETCEMLRKKIQDLELQLVSKNGQIATLEIQIQSENFPYQRKCKELEELLLTFRNKNSELSSEVRKLQRAMNDVNAWECDTCRRWMVNRRDQTCQTMTDNASQLFSMNNEVIDDHVRIMKLEKEKALIKDVCRSRCRRIKELENKIRDLEDAQNTSSLEPTEFLQEKSNQQYSSLTYFNKRFDQEKNLQPTMKENVPANLLMLTKPLIYRRCIRNN